MMSLKKSYFPLASYVKDDSDYGEFWNILKDEYELTKNCYWRSQVIHYSWKMESFQRSRLSLRSGLY
ncbi:MAG: hypothetical protein EBS24_02305 [Chitinophagia bacterium]|nr:hypothetical protein [Chitinophagia bacterium]